MTIEDLDVQSALEALLFVSDEPVSAATLAGILDMSPGDVDSELVQLSSRYREEERGMQLREVAGGWRFYTHPAYHEVIERYVLSWDTRRLSQAALEALAVVAYHQPVTRAGVNAIRGVNSEGVISSLVEKGLVRELGRDGGPGNAILYGTSRAFLEKFGLKSLKDLPPLEDFAPDEASKQFIRDRLSAGSLSLEPTLDEEQGLDYDEPSSVKVYDGEDDEGKPSFDPELVQPYDSGDETREDDPEAMADIIMAGITAKISFESLADDDDLETID